MPSTPFSPRSLIALPAGAAPSPLVTLARAATVVWLAVSAINFVVWLVICLISGSLDAPWWLWLFGVGGAVVGGLRLAAANHRPRPRAVKNRTVVDAADVQRPDVTTAVLGSGASAKVDEEEDW